jgi:hypothetical protein
MFFWAIPRRQVLVFRRFGTLCQVHLERLDVEYILNTAFCRWTWQTIPKRRKTTIWRRGNTQKNIYNIQNTAKVWNQELFCFFLIFWFSTSTDLSDFLFISDLVIQMAYCLTVCMVMWMVIQIAYCLTVCMLMWMVIHITRHNIWPYVCLCQIFCVMWEKGADKVKHIYTNYSNLKQCMQTAKRFGMYSNSHLI